MNRDFNASSKQARSILAIVAVLASVLIVSGIGGLAEHYNNSGTQLAAHHGSGYRG